MRRSLFAVVTLCCALFAPHSARAVDMKAELQKPTELTFWTWVPNIEKEVKLFEQAYPNIKVKLVNVGQGAAHYQKLRTVLKSGQGAPDVVQIEFQYIPSFVITKSLLDLSPYLPVEQFKKNYPDWIASQVVSDNHIWAVPQDSGPMGDGVPQGPPRAGRHPGAEDLEGVRGRRARIPPEEPGELSHQHPDQRSGEWIGLLWQAGSRPFGQTGKDTLKINLADPGAMKVAAFWEQLIKEGVVSNDLGLHGCLVPGPRLGQVRFVAHRGMGPCVPAGHRQEDLGQLGMRTVAGVG